MKPKGNDKKIYLDYAATTPCDKRVLEEMIPYFSCKFGNASTLYWHGQQAKEALEGAREKVAEIINAQSAEIIFTGGGTESDNTALKGIAYALRDRGKHIITSQIEHHAILKPCEFLEKEGFEVTYLPVDGFGMVDPAEVERAIKKDTILVTIMYANNEIGTIQPIKEIARITKEREVYFHTDAVQALGHVPMDVKSLGIDLMSASGHKLYGPKGIGLLYIRKGVEIEPFIHGGSQEEGRRASTENIAGTVGLGKALELSTGDLKKENANIKRLRDVLLRGLFKTVPDIELNGHPDKRLVNNINISLKNIDGEALVMYLDTEGFACSTGSACSSTSHQSSHVLAAIGLSEDQARGSLRITLGRYTTEDDIKSFLTVLPKAVNRLRSISSKDTE